MSPGTRRTFALAATLALAGSAIAAPIVAQDAPNIDDLMFGSDYAPEAGTPGGSIVIADWQIPDQLNPYYVSAFVNTQVFAATNDQLWDVSADFKYIPELAVSIPTISNGGVRIDAEPTAVCENRREGYEDIPGFEMDINIRPGLKWSDGETLDLNDYKYTMVDWMLDPDNVGLYAGTDGYNLIDRFEVSEDGLSADPPLLHRVHGLLRPLQCAAPARALHVDDRRRGCRAAVLPCRARPRERAARPLQVRQRQPERHRARPQRELGQPVDRRLPPYLDRVGLPLLRRRQGRHDCGLPGR